MIAAISLNSQTFLGHNQATYQELRAALQLHLRRQLLIAVCDNSGLQERFAHQLEADLSPCSVHGERKPQVRADQSPLATLRLDSQHPDLVREVLLWLKQQRRLGTNPGMIPAFQILGVDTLTRQSPTIQNRFLASLIRVDALLTQLECRVLVWVPRPWLGKIQQAVPGFWRSRSGLYEFEGEPTAPTESLPLDQTGHSPANLGFPTEADRSISLDPGRPWAGGTVEADPIDPPPSAVLPQPRPTTTRVSAVALPLPEALAQDDQIRHLWQYIHQLHRQQAGPLTLGRAHLALGQLCQGRVASEADRPILEFTLVVYQQAVEGLLEGENDWCDALNDMASLYWMRAQWESDPETRATWLQRSVATYRQGIDQQTTATPETLGRLHSNLGQVYGLLANLSDPQTHLEQAVMAYTEALGYTPATTAPLDYANGQNSLGTLHWQLSQWERPQYHLHQAIAAYQEALRYRMPQAEPQEYAMLQNNLGIAYWSLAQHESPIPWLEQAIDAYQTALVYRTLATSPAGCATTQNNLGTAYWDLAQQQTQPLERILSLRQAAEAYGAALDAVGYAFQQAPSEPPGFDVWATCHSAGIVHDQLALALSNQLPGEREHHLKAALDLYLLAYQGWHDQPEQLDILAEALVYSVRLHFEILGFPGQQAVLTQLPPELLGRVLPQL